MRHRFLPTATLCLAFVPVLAPAAGDAAKGKAVYLKSCSQCHGDAGDGKGPAAERFYTKPRDFTSGAYKIRTTPNGEVPSDEDLVHIVSEGMPGTTMPAWKGSLKPAEIADVVAYIKTFSSRFAEEKPSRTFSLKGARQASTESLENGRKIFIDQQCNSCHGEIGRGDGPSAPALTDDPGNPIRPANFHKGWNFRGGHRAEDIFRTLLTGLNGTPMPGYLDALGDNAEGTAKAWDLANYIRSLSPDEAPVSEVLRAKRAAGELPKSPTDPAWEAAPKAGFPLFGQIVEDPRQFEPGADHLTLRALYDDKAVAFLAEWDDPFRDPNPETTTPPDAFQLQLPGALNRDSQEGERPYFLEGDPGHPVHLARWDAKTDKIAYVKSTGISSPKESVSGVVLVSSASFADGRWSLVIRRPLDPGKGNGLALRPGEFVPAAFSLWEGARGEEGTKRSVSSWYYLLLEQQKSKAAYAYPLVTFIIIAGLQAGLLGLRARRRS